MVIVRLPMVDHVLDAVGAKHNHTLLKQLKALGAAAFG